MNRLACTLCDLEVPHDHLNGHVPIAACTACYGAAHVFCDPLTFHCACACRLGEPPMQLWYPNATRDPQEDGGSMTAGPARGILHTTESSGYPSYRPGTHPHFTVWVDAAGVPRIRQHVPLNRAARALMHPAGTIDTNRHGAIQIEIATFAAKVTAAPRSLLVATRTLMRWIEQQAGVHRHAPRFKAYPSSYGTNNGVRFTDQQWADFNGWCGHQHVPHNDHGDPGALNITFLLDVPDRPIVHNPHPVPNYTQHPIDCRTDNLTVRESVQWMQWALSITDDGKVGPITRAHLQAWQHAHGLRADAICGHDTGHTLEAVHR